MTNDNVVMWVIQLNTAGWVSSKTQILLVTLKTRNQPQGEFVCIFGSRTFVPISWMCKKQTSLSHCSMESDIISLDDGLRMDGIPALDLWHVVIEVLHSSNNVQPTQKIPTPKKQIQRSRGKVRAGQCPQHQVGERR